MYTLYTRAYDIKAYTAEIRGKSIRSNLLYFIEYYNAITVYRLHFQKILRENQTHAHKQIRTNAHYNT